MGNDANCSRLCQKKSGQGTSHDDILTTEYIVPCQICNQQFKHQALKNHIDLRHYATLREENDGNVSVECLMCSKVSGDLVQQGNHIQKKHAYADSGCTKRTTASEVITENTADSRAVSDDQLNKAKKMSAVKLDNDRQFQIINQLSSNRYEASVNGVKYEVVSFIKEYRGAEYYEELAEAELVWFNVFKEQNKCKYYFFDVQPGL